VSLEGLAGRTYEFRVRGPSERIAAETSAGAGAAFAPSAAGVSRLVRIAFPAAGANADGFTAATVVFSVR